MRRNLAAGAETGLGHFELLPAHFQHGNVVQSLAMGGVHGDGHFEGLVGQSQVS